MGEIARGLPDLGAQARARQPLEYEMGRIIAAARNVAAKIDSGELTAIGLLTAPQGSHGYLLVELQMKIDRIG